MPLFKNKDSLRTYLLTSRLMNLQDFARVQSEYDAATDVADVLQMLERRQLLTSLQSSRILKGETEGLVLGRYKLLYRNASGSFARVFRAENVETGETVALKLLRERWADDPRTVAAFQREARICQKFVHPNVVPIFEIATEGRFHYFTMEFVEGGNLRDFLKIRKFLNPLEATRCILHICLGLEYALTQGVTHRDLKLTNVLMSSTGVAKLVDFGLAGAESPTQQGTEDNQRALEYAALERGTNAPRNDPRSDLFFAGAIFYELLTGEGPWERTRDREERMLLGRYTNARPLASVNPSLPAGCIQVCEKLMKVSPSERYQSPAEAVSDLRPLLTSLGDAAETAGHGQGQAALKVEVRPDFRLLIVDTQTKRIEALKEYFGRHNFQITIMPSAENALQKLKTTPPDGMLFLADTAPQDVLQVYPQVQAWARTQKVPCLAVFAAGDAETVRKTIVSTRFGGTMIQPATLRDIRLFFEDVGAITRH